jgi:carbonic anhydrase
MSKRSEYLFSAISLWLTATSSFASSAVVCASAPHREYSGDKGPAHRAKLIVVVMVTEGEANKLLAQVWENMPQKQGDKTFLRSRILPVDDYYRFSGSLTTPPCSEGARWIVMKESITASKAQIDAFVHVMPHANNRPIQPVKARLVLE